MIEEEYNSTKYLFIPYFSFPRKIFVSTLIETIFKQTITTDMNGIAYTYSESANRELKPSVELNCFNSSDEFILLFLYICFKFFKSFSFKYKLN